MIINRNVENISVEINFLRVVLLQLLCLEKLYAQEAKCEDMKLDTSDGKKLVDFELFKSFRHKKWF